MSKVNLDINIHHVTRVEGHGNISLNVKNGKIEKCEWSVVEAPRFFESMVLGRSYKEVYHITARICGICSIGHTLAALRATENALGIKINQQDVKLRKLALHAENLQSHILHIGYLVLPDLMGVGSVIPLAASHPEELKTAIRLHRLANEMSDLICGRTTHPQSMIPGGFGKIPTLDQLKKLKDDLLASEDDINTTAKLLTTLAHKLPNFMRETEFIALASEDEYALYEGEIASTDAPNIPEDRYLEYTNEYLVPESTAKYCKNKRESYMVGALARVNINYDKLTPRAKTVAEMFNLKPVCHNPFMNTVAQLVEVVHSIDDSVKLIDELVSGDYKYYQPDFKPTAGRGVAAVEVPRGILIHDYTYDDGGVCKEANCVIPTNQNHANIQHDMEALAPTIIDRPKEEIELTLEMLVRAYDPCISCSTHYLNVEFV
jgi:coenzyme F420-reducing hydrogenase alpha subunit